MARIRRSDERLDPEFSHDAWAEQPHLDMVCPNCEDILLVAKSGTLIFECPACGYCEERNEACES